MALLVTVLLLTVELQAETVVFASGSPTGNYYALAQALAEQHSAWCPGCDLEVLTTSGSYDNARLLRESEADLALIQSDVAYLEYFEGRPFFAIAAPYTEPVHIVARRELGLQRLSQLATAERQFKVAIGPDGSGSASHALTLLHELRSEGASFETLQVPLAEGLDLLQARTADLAFITSAVPIPALEDLVRQDAISFLEVDADLARKLRRKNPFFSFAEIPYRAYGNATNRSVATLGTRTLLVVRRGFREERIESLLDSLYRLGGPDSRLLFLRHLEPSSGLQDTSIPVHQMSLDYHRRHENHLRLMLRQGRRYLLPLIVLLTPLLVFLLLPRATLLIHQFVLGRIFVLLVAIWLVGSAAMHLLEGQKNSSFRSFGSSALAILHYLFSGFEAKYPITVAGNVVAVIVLSMGVAVVTLFTATVVTLLVEKALDVRRVRSKPPFRRMLKNHVVLIGWSARVERILRQLRSPDLGRRPTIVVVNDERPQPEQLDGRSLRGVWSVVEDGGLHDALRRADLAKARLAVVPAAESARSAAWDSAAAALAIDRIAPAIHAVVEVPSQDGEEYVEQSAAREVVVTEVLGERLISQCAITPGLVAVYEELLTFGVGSQEIYVHPLPRYLNGSTFDSLRRELLLLDVTPIGYRSATDDQLRINPRRDNRVLGEGREGEADELVFIADNPKALRRSLWKRWGATSTLTAKEEKMMEPSQRHSEHDTRVEEASIGICGWNQQARAVIEQLSLSVIASHHRFSITVVNEPEQTDFAGQANGDLHEHVRFVIGDPTRRQVLRNAGVAGFRSLIILADRSGEAASFYSDHRALMIALAARKINPALHIIVELIDSQNREHFDQLPELELVSVQELAEKLLAQAVVNPGISRVYLELLTATEDSNEIYIIPIPRAWVGRTYQQVSAALVVCGESIIPIGYRSRLSGSDRPVIALNPPQTEEPRGGRHGWRGHSLKGDDALVVIAYDEPDLSKVQVDP